MVGRLQEEEAPIDEAIVNEVVELTPEWWRSAALEVTYSSEDGIEKYAHVISSLDGHKEPVVPSDKLYAATHDLGSLFRRDGKHWKRVRYEIRLQDDGSWKYTVAFEY
ncbi:MAG: hypothetical protein AB1714_03250 [Acidobacteriota bacterium]